MTVVVLHISSGRNSISSGGSSRSVGNGGCRIVNTETISDHIVVEIIVVIKGSRTTSNSSSNSSTDACLCLFCDRHSSRPVDSSRRTGLVRAQWR